MGTKIGIIDETGDLGLGFDELNEKDQKEYNKAMSRKDKESKKDSNSRQK